MEFEWDPEKDRLNRKLHGVSFDEAKELFTGDDDYLGIGPIQAGLVLVVYTERTEETIRIISARWATESEALLYRQYMGRIK